MRGVGESIDPVSAESPSALTAGREALVREDWATAYQQLSEVAHADLSPKELEGLASAAWAVGNVGESITAREHAHAGFVAAGDRANAAWTAAFLAGSFYEKGDLAVAGGWQSTAERILAEIPECPAHARVQWGRAFVSVALGDFDAAIEHARGAAETARRVGSRDIEMLAIHVEGRARVKRGEVAEGMPLVDEASAAAVSGVLRPWASLPILCFTITTCQELADYKRAGEWIEAADRAAVSQGVEFSQDCHIHRAAILKLHGSWPRAEAEARLGCARHEYSWHNGWGWCEIGEIRLRMGDLAGAEEAFETAHEKGYPPHPGFALLRLAQGEVDLATTAIDRALTDAGSDRLARARLLDARVTIAVAAADAGSARTCADELAEIAAAFASEALNASAVQADGAARLLEGDAAGATEALRRACQSWAALEMPYDAARAHVALARALQKEGDRDGAGLELRAARSAFEQLGAELDERSAAALLAELSVASAPSSGRRVERTFMFTDIESSTALTETLGDGAWDDVLRSHDRVLREVIADHGGRVVKHEGDGFFVSLDDPTRAVGCALTIQRQLARHRTDHGFAPRVRIGLHAGEATERGGDYFGAAVNATARVMSLAGGGEVVATAETVGDLSCSSSPPRSVQVKGIRDPLNVVTVKWSAERADHSG